MDPRATPAIATYHKAMARMSVVIAHALGTAATVGAVIVLALGFNSNQIDPRDIPVLRPSPVEDGGLQNAIEGHDPVWGSVWIYPVIEDGTLHPAPGGTLGGIWAVFTRVVTPAYATEHMSALVAANDPDNPILAAVAISNVEPLRWTLTVNVGQPIYRSRFPRVLLHEYAHLLALDDEQVDRSGGTCATLHLPEGCLRPGSDLLRFHEAFWDPLVPTTDAPAGSSGWSNYVDHEDQFINSQAAMNVVEDFSESFVAFIIRDKPDPASGTWARKLLYFWDRPAYVAIRDHIWHWYGDYAPEPATEFADRPGGG